MIFTDSERIVAERIARLAYINPFLPERVELERLLLGRAFLPTPPVLHLEAGFAAVGLHPNIVQLQKLTTRLVEQARNRLMSSSESSSTELELYGDVCLFSLYMLVEQELDVRAGDAASTARSAGWQECWRRFAREFERLLRPVGRPPVIAHSAEHAFAVFFQITRAFRHIFEHILGSSPPAARLRAAVWESIFSHDLRQYSRWLYRRMDQIATLVTGPSGTGKELVARAIGVSQYIPFDSGREEFVCDHGSAFQAVNLSALPATLIESELFGHHKGAFTGASAARVGWLEQCPGEGAVFLDEIGELEASLQVKLLRVLQTRTFQRLGETVARQFRGKLIAATNRDLAAEMQSSRFRQDLYYRLCADQIVTPSLHDQLKEAPEDLQHFVAHVARRIFGEDSNDLQRFAVDAVSWIEQRLGTDYTWPGNIRELEQCVRNLLIHRNYQPAIAHRETHAGTPLAAFLSDVEAASLTRDEILGRYFALVLSKAATLELAADQLGVDRRTLKRLIDQQFLNQLRLVSGGSSPHTQHR